MPGQINVAPVVFKNFSLKVAADNYEKHVSSVSLVPATSAVTWKGGTPDAVFTDVTSATWSLELAYAQDWTTTNSLSVYLLNNEGQTKTVEFSPLGSGPKFVVKVIIVPGSVGGAIDSYGVSTVTLGVQGKPDFTPGTVTP